MASPRSWFSFAGTCGNWGLPPDTCPEFCSVPSPHRHGEFLPRLWEPPCPHWVSIHFFLKWLGRICCWEGWRSASEDTGRSSEASLFAGGHPYLLEGKSGARSKEVGRSLNKPCEYRIWGERVELGVWGQELESSMVWTLALQIPAQWGLNLSLFFICPTGRITPVFLHCLSVR